jgi:hypothetical protein
MSHKIKNQRQYLESCLNNRGIESKMMISSTSNVKYSRGFKTEVSDFIERKIGGKSIKVYVKQSLKNSLSRKNLELLCKRIVTRQLFKKLGLAGITSIVILCFPKLSRAIDMGDVPLPMPEGLDPVSGRPIMSQSGVHCEQVAMQWYRACCSYKNLYGKPSIARQWDCAAHTVFACVGTTGMGAKLAGTCAFEQDWKWTGAALIAGGGVLMLASRRSQEAYMYWTMTDWCDCGMGEEKGIFCPTSWSAARAYVGSPGFWEEASSWLGFMRENPQYTDLSDTSLKFSAELLKNATANGTLPKLVIP